MNEALGQSAKGPVAAAAATWVRWLFHPIASCDALLESSSEPRHRRHVMWQLWAAAYVLTVLPNLALYLSLGWKTRSALQCAELVVMPALQEALSLVLMLGTLRAFGVRLDVWVVVVLQTAFRLVYLPVQSIAGAPAIVSSYHFADDIAARKLGFVAALRYSLDNAAAARPPTTWTTAILSQGLGDLWFLLATILLMLYAREVARRADTATYRAICAVTLGSTLGVAGAGALSLLALFGYTVRS